MHTRDTLIQQYNKIDSGNEGKLSYDKIVVLVQSIGMNTTGQKVIAYFDNNKTQHAGYVSQEEFIEWFKTTCPMMYTDN